MSRGRFTPVCGLHRRIYDDSLIWGDWRRKVVFRQSCWRGGVAVLGRYVPDLCGLYVIARHAIATQLRGSSSRRLGRNGASGRLLF